MGKKKEIEKFEVLSEHEDNCIFIVSPQEFRIYKEGKEHFYDYQQGNIGNCGLAAALAALSKHHDFSKIFSSITSEISRKNEVSKIKLNMYRQGKKETVIIDNTLPFNKKTSKLIYARSAKYNNVLKAAILEKAFVKACCSKSYKLCKGIDPVFVFSRFSDSVIDVKFWKTAVSKKKALYSAGYGLHRNHSVVLSVSPSFEQEHDSNDTDTHAYTAIEYRQELDALKIYEPNCFPAWCVSNKNLPQEVIEAADPRHGELWIKTEDLEKRTVCVTSLLSKKELEHVRVLAGKNKLKLNQKLISYTTFKVEVKEETRFIFNFFSNISTKNSLVINAVWNNNNDKAKLSNKLDYDFSSNKKSIMEEKHFSVRKVTLEPNTYTFYAYRQISDEELKDEEGSLLVEEERFHFRIGSDCEFSLEEIDESDLTKIERRFEAVNVSNSNEGGQPVIEE